MIGFGEALEAIRWLLGPDANDPLARTVFCFMVGEPERAPNPYPWFMPVDIGPLVRLLRTFPSWRGQLKDIPKRWPDVALWLKIVKDWDEMVREYEEKKRSEQG